MGFLSEGLEPLREAQEKLLEKLDLMLVELRGISESLSDVKTLLAAERAHTIDLSSPHLNGAGDSLVN